MALSLLPPTKLARLLIPGDSAEISSSYVRILASAVNVIFPYSFRVPTNPLRDIISSQVARLLKEERKKRGLSLNQLAEKAGLSRQTVSYVEQEVQSPTLDTLLRLTSALDVQLDRIIARARKLASARSK